MSYRHYLACTIAVALAACSGGMTSPTPPSGSGIADTIAPAAKIAFSPAKLSVYDNASAPVVVSEKGYTGTFTGTSTGASKCKGIATWSPLKGKGPKLTVTVKGVKIGACSIVFSDAHGNAATLHVKVEVPPPLEYIYTANYNSNDISQLAFNSDGSLVTIAPNYKLPSSCTGPDAIALVPTENLAFVTCYSGELLPLTFNAKHEMAASTIAPAPVASPLYLLVPQTGASGKIYVDGQGQTNGSVVAFAFTKTSLTQLGSYTTPGSYPDQMAFSTNAQGSSTLFVASPFDPATGCTGSVNEGTIERWAQNSDGTLAAQPSIDVCAVFYNIAVANGNLYWAGASGFGAYSLATNAPVTVPAPPWPATKGPGYNPAAMNVVLPQPATAPAGPQGGSADYTLSVTSSNGYVYILGPTGTTLATIPLLSVISGGAFCKTFPLGTTIDKHDYSKICWAIDGDGIEVTGFRNGSWILLASNENIGSMPYGMAIGTYPVY